MKTNHLQRAKFALTYLLKIHLVALIVFTIFRAVLFFSMDYTFPVSIQGDWGLQAIAFVKGVWFDNVIACYILALPLVILWVTSLCYYTAKWIYLLTGGWFISLYSLAFVVSAANIPYFQYFFKPINASIYNWFGYVETTAGMIFGETSYYFPIALGLTAIVLWGIGIHKLSKRTYERSIKVPKGISLQPRGVIFLSGIILLGACFLGIRGTLGHNPIRISQAYYCEDPFLNQLGMNPVFNLMRSTIESGREENQQLQLMDGQTAIDNAQRLLNRSGVEDVSPIAQIVASDTSVVGRPNIVFILMESMSAKLMGAYGQTKNLTPYLDSLYHEALVFDNIYSAGIHTNQGVFSTLYSFPAVMKRNAMKGSVVPVYSGLPTVLKDNGYQTLFFMTHESQYDNMNAFLRTNGFEEIHDEENYPKEKIVNRFGVQDDYLFEYALPVLNERAQSGQPFFSVLLTISNHPPYIIPAYFQPKSEKVEDQIVEYADWSIRNFMTKAQEQPWFENTVFVFVADHGKLVGTPENEMPEACSHVPFMIYWKGIEPNHISNFGGQIDVAPTLLGILGIGYTQNNFGVDLLKEQRPCSFYTDDNLVAARDSAHLYLHSPETGQEFCYTIQNGTLKSSASDANFEALKEYVFSMLQATEQLVKEGKTTTNQ